MSPKLYSYHTGPETVTELIPAMDLVENKPIHGSDPEPIPVLEPILNPYQSRNQSWNHTGSGTNTESISVIELMLHPYRLWN